LILVTVLELASVRIGPVESVPCVFPEYQRNVARLPRLGVGLVEMLRKVNRSAVERKIEL